MKELLARYDPSEIFVFVVFLIIGLKELISAIDWFRARIKKSYDAESNLMDEVKDLNKFYDEKEVVDSGFEKVNARIDNIEKVLEMLVESDKESIKSYITEQHRFFVQERKWIDYHSMDCLERRFAIYEKEHGNSFVEDLMNEIRQLPKMPIDQETP